MFVKYQKKRVTTGPVTLNEEYPEMNVPRDGDRPFMIRTFLIDVSGVFAMRAMAVVFRVNDCGIADQCCQAVALFIHGGIADPPLLKRSLADTGFEESPRDQTSYIPDELLGI